MRDDQLRAIHITSWSGGTVTLRPSLAQDTASVHRQSLLPFQAEEQTYTGRCSFPTTGTAIFDLVSPRSLRLWLAETLVLDEELDWRSYQREIRAVVLFPCDQGSCDFRVEVARRPSYPVLIEQQSPSRNRERVLNELQRLRPDTLSLIGTMAPSITKAGTPLSLRFLPAQFQQNGILWQHLLVRFPAELPSVPLRLSSAVPPHHGQEGTQERDRQRGLRRWYVPVAASRDELRPLRPPGPETRVEPVLEIVHDITLTVEQASLFLEIRMPVYEALGRLAPQREYQTVVWPAWSELGPQVPQPVLPAHLSHLTQLYDAGWDMLLRLVREAKVASGLPGSYVSIGSNFPDHLFVWDTSFTALCTAYGHRVLPVFASLNALYSRQFDGGYIHREHDVHEGLPALFEPDFSPNPRS